MPRLNLDGIDHPDGTWQIWSPAHPNPWQSVTVRWWHDGELLD